LKKKKKKKIDFEENVEKQSSILDKKNTMNFIKRINRANEKKKLSKKKAYDMTNKFIFSYQNFQLTKKKKNFTRLYKGT